MTGGPRGDPKPGDVPSWDFHLIPWVLDKRCCAHPIPKPTVLENFTSAFHDSVI